ncbi:hypothetical protein BDD12DRAFT_827741, partial [Trichophaea hybrida]
MASASRIARFLVSHTQFYMGFALCIARSLASHTQFFMGFALFTAGSLVPQALSHRVSLALWHRSHSGIACTLASLALSHRSISYRLLSRIEYIRSRPIVALSLS